MKPRLIDLNRITSLSYITEAAGEIRVGALTRQRHLEIASILRETLPLIARATAEIGGIAVRNRGTIGGSLAHADPAAGARRILGRRRP
jgi:carbon-monoxide dehydrogenase medium subunit